MAASLMLMASAVVVAGVGAYANQLRLRLRRESHIRGYMFPRGLFEKLTKLHPTLDVKQQQMVARALRQFFLAYLKSGCKRVAMPSQVVDDLWHEFILFTRDYADFCQRAFGQFLHHTPAVKMGGERTDNEGLRRVWWYCCVEENINPRKPTRLPLLFALDKKLGIATGFVYHLDCGRAPRETQAAGDSGGQCATYFSDPTYDGTTDGFGCSSGGSSHGGQGHHGGHDSHGGHDGGGDSGCSGGCGGGD